MTAFSRGPPPRQPLMARLQRQARRNQGKSRRRACLPELLDLLEELYGKQEAALRDAYLMILFANCGYPPSEDRCSKGFEALRRSVGVGSDKILAAKNAALTAAMRAGGIVPELRARRLKEIATLVQEDFGGDLRAVLKEPLPQAKKALKRFPTIGDPGAEKILLFTGTAAIPAVPSNCVHVLHRLGLGEENKNYAAGYRSSQLAVSAELPNADCETLIRAHLLLKKHGQEVCKRSRPLCDRCPVSKHCPYFSRTLKAL
jgi:endonuclease-3